VCIRGKDLVILVAFWHGVLAFYCFYRSDSFHMRDGFRPRISEYLFTPSKAIPHSHSTGIIKHYYSYA
jgi:hypothetical protein